MSLELYSKVFQDVNLHIRCTYNIIIVMHCVLLPPITSVHYFWIHIQLYVCNCMWPIYYSWKKKRLCPSTSQKRCWQYNATYTCFHMVVINRTEQFCHNIPEQSRFLPHHFDNWHAILSCVLNSSIAAGRVTYCYLCSSWSVTVSTNNMAMGYTC